MKDGNIEGTIDIRFPVTMKSRDILQLCKDKKKKAFSVDSMSTNMSLWFKRLRTEGIKTNKTSEKSMEFYQLNK